MSEGRSMPPLHACAWTHACESMHVAPDLLRRFRHASCRHNSARVTGAGALAAHTWMPAAAASKASASAWAACGRRRAAAARRKPPCARMPAWSGPAPAANAAGAGSVHAPPAHQAQPCNRMTHAPRGGAACSMTRPMRSQGPRLLHALKQRAQRAHSANRLGWVARRLERPQQRAVWLGCQQRV